MQKKEIVIIGIGRYSLELIELLKNIPKYSIVAIDSDPKKLEMVTGVKSLLSGDSTDAEFMKSAGIENADLFIIGMGRDFKASLLTASIIIESFKGTVIAKSISPQHEQILTKLGVLSVIVPEITAARLTFSKIISPIHLTTGDAPEINELSPGVSATQIKIPESLYQVSVKDANIPVGIVVPIIKRKKKAIIVNGDTVFEDGDEAIIMGNTNVLIKLMYSFNEEIKKQG